MSSDEMTAAEAIARGELELDYDTAGKVPLPPPPETEPMMMCGLRLPPSPAPGGSAHKQYRLEPHDSQLSAGLDLAGFNRFADELEDEATLLRMHGGPTSSTWA
jgi:hypothetical protein